MIFFFYGEDSFRAHQKIQAIVDKFRKTVDPHGQNIEYLDGETIKADDFFQSVNVIGFLASKKLLIIKNIFSNKKLATWEKNLTAFLDKQKDTVDENYVIFWETDKPDSRRTLYKRLSKFKFVEEFPKLSPAQLHKWISQEVKNHGKAISPQAMEKLLSFVGGDLWQINQEISKLCHFVPGYTINEDDVKIMVQAKIDDNIFNLINAFGRKNKPLALALIEDKLNSGVNAQYILSMIIRQYRLLIKTKALAKDLPYAGALAQTLKIPGWLADSAWNQSKLYTPDQLSKIYGLLLELDEKLKSSAQSEKILFTKMISQL